MTDSAGEDSYVEPPLSQLEIPYKMNFSSSEDEKKKEKEKKGKKSRKRAKGNKRNSRTGKYDSSYSDSDDDSSSSSSCPSFDSIPNRKVTNREPLRVNDIISYTPPVFTIGTHVKQAVVLGIWPDKKSFPLILDNADMLPWDTSIQRIGEFYQGQIYKHSGRIKPLSSFRLHQGGTKDVTIGLQEKASNFKRMLQDMQQRAMATLRGDMKSPSKSKSPALSHGKPPKPKRSSSFTLRSDSDGDNNRSKKKEDDLAIMSSDSSSSLSARRNGRSKVTRQKSTVVKRPVATTVHSKQVPKRSTPIESSDDSSSFSSDQSTTLAKLKRPRGYRNNRLSLTKTNNAMTLPTRGTNNRSTTKPRKMAKKQTVQSSAKSTKVNSVEDSSDDDPIVTNPKGLKARERKKSRLKKDAADGATKPSKLFRPLLNLNDDTDSDHENDPKGLISKKAQDKLQKHRRERKSLPRGDTVIWSGSDSDGDGLFDKTLESHRRNSPRKRKKVLEGHDYLANLAGNKNAPSIRVPTTTNTKNYSNTELSSSDESSKVPTTTKNTPKKKESIRLPQMTNAALGLGSEDSSDDEEDDLLFKATPPFSKKKSNNQTPKKQAFYNRTNQKESTAAFYDADEDSEDDDALLRKEVWYHNHSSERNVKSPSPSKKQRTKESRNKTSPVSNSPKSFPKSPNNESRSRLVHAIRNQKMTPSPGKVNQQSYELSSSSDSDSDGGRRINTNKRRYKDSWTSDDCSVDSPPPEEDSISPTTRPTPKRNKKKPLNRKRAKRKRPLDDEEFDFDPNNEAPCRCTRGRKILSPKSKRGTSKVTLSSIRKKSSVERPQSARRRWNQR